VGNNRISMEALMRGQNLGAAADGRLTSKGLALGEDGNAALAVSDRPSRPTRRTAA